MYLLASILMATQHSSVSFTTLPSSQLDISCVDWSSSPDRERTRPCSHKGFNIQRKCTMAGNSLINLYSTTSLIKGEQLVRQTNLLIKPFYTHFIHQKIRRASTTVSSAYMSVIGDPHNWCVKQVHRRLPSLKCHVVCHLGDVYKQKATSNSAYLKG